MTYHSSIPDFSIPQRQSPVGVVIEILIVLRKGIQILWPLLLLVILRFGEFDWRYKVLVLLFMLISVAIIGYLNYRNFLFYIDDEKKEFILERGVFNKKKIVIGFARIQQVNINQSYIQKLVDVFAVELETAGSAKSEATINAISKAVAGQLRTKLLGAVSSAAVASEVSGTTSTVSVLQPDPVLRINFGSLVKTGITSDYLRGLGLLIAFVSAVYSNLKDTWLRDEANESRLINYVSSFNTSQYLLLLFSAIVLMIFVVNLVRMIVVYYDFRISLHGKSLLLSYGLFNTKNTIIKPSKVQVIRVVNNYIQRKLNLGRLRVQQASSDFLSDKKATLQIPGCNARERDFIVRLILGKLPQKGGLLKPNIRKLLASFIKLIIIPGFLYLVVSFSYRPLLSYAYLMPFYVLLMVILMYFSYRNNRLFVHEESIIIQSGIWDITTEYLQPWKIQSITTRQNLWHVKANIGHVTLHTAGGDIEFRFGDFSRIQGYVNEWLYHVESSEKEWM